MRKSEREVCIDCDVCVLFCFQIKERVDALKDRQLFAGHVCCRLEITVPVGWALNTNN